MRYQRRKAAAVALALAMMATSAGCGAAPWTDAAEPSPTATESLPSPERTFGDDSSGPSPTPSETPVVNDLAEGHTERSLAAGAVTLDVDYWSELPMDQWTAAAPKPLSLSLSATIEPDDGQQVFLQRATLIAAAAGSDPLAEQADQSTEDPGYLVLAPYSYSQTFTVGGLAEDATSVTLLLRYELLVQTTPTSDTYAKQTATDTLTISLAG